ncbi:MAG: hypothetical protein Q9159_003152 [Coniocarpon cinnabarinum]
MAHRRMISRADLEATVGRSGPGGMAPNPQQPRGPPPHEYYEQAYRERSQMELAKRRAVQPTDRNLPDGIEKLVPEKAAENYNQLRALEQQLDAIMMRKRIDIQDSIQTSPAGKGTLRLWISNTVENQPWQQNNVMDHDAFDFSSNVEATFKVKIEGKLLSSQRQDGTTEESKEESGPSADKDEDREPASKRPRLSSDIKPPKKLSGFFKAITIDFDRSAALQPDNYTGIAWDKASANASTDQRAADFDVLEFQRKGDENINITINLTRDEQNPKMKLAPTLARLLGMELADRKTVLMGLWEYIKVAKLHSEGSNGRHVQCDQALKDALNCGDSLYLPELPQLANAVLFDAPPLSLPYTIRVDKAFHSGDKPSPPTIYDIPVTVENPTRDQMASTISPRAHIADLQRIVDVDNRLAIVVQSMNQAKAKHGFFSSMSKDPANFIKRWTSSQKRDMDIILGAGPWGEEDWQSAEWRQGGGHGPWGTNEAWEGVGSYLMKQDASRQRGAAAS